MMKRSWFWLVLLLMFIGCAGTPATHYYLLKTQEPETAHEKSPLILGIYPVTVDRIYNDYNIAYQNSPYQIQFYNYHKWVNSPADLINQVFMETIRNSNRFSRVLAFPTTEEVNFAIMANVTKFLEWDQGEQWFGMVEMDYKIFRNGEDDPVVQDTLSQKILAKNRTPIEVVKALSQAVNNIAEAISQRVLELE